MPGPHILLLVDKLQMACDSVNFFRICLLLSITSCYINGRVRGISSNKECDWSLIFQLKTYLWVCQTPWEWPIKRIIASIQQICHYANTHGNIRWTWLTDQFRGSFLQIEVSSTTNKGTISPLFLWLSWVRKSLRITPQDPPYINGLVCN